MLGADRFLPAAVLEDIIAERIRARLWVDNTHSPHSSWKYWIVSLYVDVS